MQYRKLTGAGPPTGWITVFGNGKWLAQVREAPSAAATAALGSPPTAAGRSGGPEALRKEEGSADCGEADTMPDVECPAQPLEPEPDGVDGLEGLNLLGTWLDSDGEAYFDIIAGEPEAGVPEPLREAAAASADGSGQEEERGTVAASSEEPAALEGARPCLRFFQWLAGGKAWYGPVECIEHPDWQWEVKLNDGSWKRLRRGQQAGLLEAAHSPAYWRQTAQHFHRPRCYAFYNAYWDHPDGYRYAHVPGIGVEFPLIGLTAGWLPATVLEGPVSSSRHGTRGNVKVKFDGGFWDPFEAHVSLGGKTEQAMQIVATWRKVAPGGRGKGWSHSLPPFASGKGRGRGRGRLLMSMQQQREERLVPVEGQAYFKEKTRALKGCGFKRSLERSVPVSLTLRGGKLPPRPLLSIVCIRWFDYWTDAKHSDYSIRNDGYMADLFMGPGSIHDHLPGEYEVYTVFVRSSAALKRLDPRQLRAALKGKHVVTWYLIWPSYTDNGFDTDYSALGFVSESEFFTFMHAMERGEVRTGWPHTAHLYRQLCGKLWIPQMSLNPQYRVPPTTRVHYAEFRRDMTKAATRALECLMQVRQRVWQKEPVSFETFRGVVKLGFSWGGLDVLPFQGVNSLVSNLRRLFETKNCSATVCLVQEMIPGVVGEHRVVCFWDSVHGRFLKEPVWMIIMKPTSSNWDVNDFKLATSKVCQPAQAAREIFHGDDLAVRAAEAQAQSIVDRWLNYWYKTEMPEPPQCTRIDFLCTHPRDGGAEVWTCEVGECGASLCSLEVVARNRVVLNKALANADQTRFPMPLPDPLPRNSGWKS